MPGKRFLLDTNAIIQLLAGNRELVRLVESAEFVASSIVCELEFLSFPGLSTEDAELFARLRSRIRIFGLPENDPLLTGRICAMRFNYGLKLPDAIIAGTAQHHDCAVVTADAHFAKINEAESVVGYTPIVIT